MKAIFDAKPTSIYNDDLTRHYQFPSRYFNLVEQCIGDWVILRRPRADGGNLAYFATAQISRVDLDPREANMYYARFSNYLDFDNPVPWRRNGRYAEEALRDIPTSEVGVYLRGRSIRLISDADFISLIAVGLQETFNPQNADQLGVPDREAIVQAAHALHADNNEPHGERVRRVQEMLINRNVRDANFRRSVCAAYGGRCAITGLRITDRSGRTEAQAAHILAVSREGPDIVQNGIALSGTIHWLFDRYLISLTVDCRLLIAKEKVPSELRTLFVGEGEQILLPADQNYWPHPRYIERHRAVFSANN